MPLRSGAFRTGLSPFGSGMLPPYQSDYAVTPPGSTPPRPGPAPAPGGNPPGKGGTIPKVQHVAVRHVPHVTSVRPKPKTRPRPKTGVQAVGAASKRGVQAVAAAKPKPIPSPGGGGTHYKI